MSLLLEEWTLLFFGGNYLEFYPFFFLDSKISIFSSFLKEKPESLFIGANVVLTCSVGIFIGSRIMMLGDDYRAPF